jgi:signal transduction histidine kinase
MKLTVKLTLFLLAIIAVVLGIDAIVRFRQEVALFRSTRAEEHERVGIAVARMIAAVYAYEGLDEARRVLEDAARRSESITMAWVCRDAVTEARITGACGRLREMPSPKGGPDGAGSGFLAATVGQRYVTYVPLRANNDQWLGALELSEPVARERRFVGRLVENTVAAMLAVGSACVIASFVLGTWLVGRPIARLIKQARVIAEGNLTHVPMFEGADELGDLSREMDRTVDALRESQARVAREQAAREETLRKLHHSDRLSTVGKLASGMAHELGTPLNVVVVNANLLRNEARLTPLGAESVESIQQASDRITKLVSTLLAFARRPNLAKTAVDLCEVTRSTSGMLEALAQSKGVQLAVELPGEAMLCEADALALSQALANLVVNAIDASPRDSEVQLRGTVTGTEVRLAVRDHGPGVPEELRSAIFEPFFTTKDVGEGTGLGLSIAYEIATAHNGTIDLTVDGGGSTFTLSLPRTPAGEGIT